MEPNQFIAPVNIPATYIVCSECRETVSTKEQSCFLSSKDGNFYCGTCVVKRREGVMRAACKACGGHLGIVDTDDDKYMSELINTGHCRSCALLLAPQLRDKNRPPSVKPEYSETYGSGSMGMMGFASTEYDD